MRSGEKQDDDSSDYGSDFTSDEEELLNELLERVVAAAKPTTTPSTPPSEQHNLSDAVHDLQPLSQPLLVTDIEDYEVPHAARIPKVLGREAWSPASKRVWQQKQHLPPPPPQQLAQKSQSSYPSSLQNHARFSSSEREGSSEGRPRELERQQAREKKWTETQEKADAQTTNDTTAAAAAATEDAHAQQPSPLQRFRKPPNKALSVSDLIAPAWCELQYLYTLTKHGRKRATPAMKQGSAVHKVLEDEVHTTVPIDITTKEDGWALRIWNVIQGLRTLRENGMTRELEVWGLVEGEIVTGVIDQLSYICPNPKLETTAAEHYAEAEASRAVLPEYQMSITDYLLSPSGGGRRFDEMWKDTDEPAIEAEDEDYLAELDQSYLDVPRIYMTDIKTRASRSIPSVSSTSFRPTRLQLQLYYHMLNRSVTSDDVTMEMIAQRYDLNPGRPFTDAFIAEVGGLNEEYFDALSSPGLGSDDPDYVQGASSQDSISILLSHNNLSSLWNLMRKHLRYTFLPTYHNKDIAPSIPAAMQPASLELYPTVLSPVLTAKYLSSATVPEGVAPDELGSRSFLFDPWDLTSYASDQLNWWRGDREPRGVEVFDAWKCRICEFREECDWRQAKEYELATRRRRLPRTAMDMLGA